MGTTAQKLQRVLDTKEGLKDTINTYLGQDITSAIPFKDYETYIKNFYNSLPKTDYAEGSNITLSNTLKGKLDFEEDEDGKKKIGYGQTEQDSTEGYNLLNSAGGNVAYKPEGTTITIDSKGVINASADMGYASINIPSITLKAGTTYTFKRNFTGSYNSYLVDTNNNNVLGIGYNKTSATATFETDTVINKLNGALLSGDNYFWLYEGTTLKDFEPYTNGASPNPSYPQDIEVVRGKNRLPLNEADFTTTFYGQNVEIKDEVIKISGSATEVYSIMVGKNGLVTPTDTNRITFKVNSGTYKYTQFASGTSYSGINVRLKDEDTNIMYTTGSTITLTETHTFSINIFMADTDSKNAEIKIQLEKGSQATSYLPYNTLEVVERGINELNKDDELRQGGSIGAGTDYVSTRISISCKKKLKANTTYTLVTNLDLSKFYYAFVLGTKIAPWSVEQQLFDSGWKTNINYVSYTTNQECYINIPIRNLAGNTIIPSDIDDYWFMLYEGEYDSSIDYEPYQTPQTYQLSLGEYEFAKIGNYVDTIEYDVDEDKVYKNEKIGKKVVDGTEGTFTKPSTNRFNIDNLITDYYKLVNNITYLSNYYVAYAQKTTNGDFNTLVNNVNYGFNFSNDTTTNPIRIKDTRYDDINQYKAWLSTNNLIIYYIKAIPTKTEITGTLKDQIKALYNSHSFTGTTIIEIDGQLPLIIKVRALKGE